MAATSPGGSHSRRARSSRACSSRSPSGSPSRVSFDRCDVLHGEEGLARIDLAGSAHGRSGSLMRRLQSVLSDEADHAREYTEHLEAGHYVVGVRVGDDEAAKVRAADALRAGPAESLRYYAENYVEDL